MDCKHVQALLPVYLDGGLSSPATIRAVKQHLETCADCRAERDADAAMLARAARTIATAGERISVPDAQWGDGVMAQRVTVTARPAIVTRQPNHNHNRGQTQTMNTMTEQPRAARRMSAWAGAASFAVVLVMLAALALAMSGLGKVNTASAPMAAGGTETVTPSANPSQTPTTAPTASQTPTATPDLASGPGGFVENVVDVAELPEYVIPLNGGGGGGGGGGCPEVPATQTVSQYGPGTGDGLTLCLYDIPSMDGGQKLTVTLTSPSGKRFSEQYTIELEQEGPPLVKPVDAGRNDGFIESEIGRRPVELPVRFYAAQEYGDWRVEAVMADGKTFASGTISVVVHDPIYSVSNVDNPLDPFVTSLEIAFQAGDRVLLAGRGMQEAGASKILALYASDPAQATQTTWTMVAYYATRLTIADDGTFRSVFVVGAQTPQYPYQAVFDPKRGPFEPAPFGIWVAPPQ